MGILEISTVFGLLLTILSYMIGVAIQKKVKIDALSPFLLSILIIIAVLLVLDVDYETYNASASYLVYLLTPTTVCLAIPLYEQMTALKNNYKAILIAVIAGSLSSMGSIYLMARLFSLTTEQYTTLLPKSITTAIAMGVIEEYGGIVSLTIIAIVITGVLGNCFAVIICNVAKIKHPISQGLAIGTASHGSGTAKALQMGEIQGAMSGLAMVIAGIVTVAFASFFVMIY